MKFRFSRPVKYSVGPCQLKISDGVTATDAHRSDGKRYVVRVDENLTAFLELAAQEQKAV